ncbi:MAG: hypothetical protein ACR2PY_04425 [Salinispira sp.]
MSDEQKVWNRAHKVKGGNPDVVRQDIYGRMILRDKYGENTKYGWKIKSIGRGDRDNVKNLYAVKTRVHSEKAGASE